MRFEFNLDFYNPYYEGYVGGEAGKLQDCTVTVVERRKRFYWPKLQWRMARRCVVTFCATDLGEFWSFEP